MMAEHESSVSADAEATPQTVPITPPSLTQATAEVEEDEEEWEYEYSTTETEVDHQPCSRLFHVC